MSSSANGPRSSNASRPVRPPTQGFCSMPAPRQMTAPSSRSRSPRARPLPSRCSVAPTRSRWSCRRSARSSVVVPSTMSWMGVARRLLNMRSILHLHGLRHLRTRNPCPRRPLHPRAPARRSQKRHRWRHRPRRRLNPLRPNRLFRSPRLRPSHPTWPRPPGCAPTTPPALLPRASSRPSPHPERPSARPLPRLSPPRRLRRGNPSRFPTTMPWSAVLLPMPAGTICPRSTCRVRRPRPSPLQLPPKRRTLLRLPGSPTPARAAPSAIRAQPQASRRPRTRPKPSSAVSSVKPPSSNRWSSCTGGYTAQEETSLNGASL